MARRKYSLNERIRYYRDRDDGTPTKRAFSFGFLDMVCESSIDSSKFKTDSEKEAYLKGVERGEAALRKSSNIKF